MGIKKRLYEISQTVVVINGGPLRARTADPLIKSQLGIPYFNHLAFIKLLSVLDLYDLCIFDFRLYRHCFSLTFFANSLTASKLIFM